MKKLGQIFKNKDIVDRIFFTLMILLVFRIGASISVPGVKISETAGFDNLDVLSMMNLLGGGALSSFSILPHKLLCNYFQWMYYRPWPS